MSAARVRLLVLVLFLVGTAAAQAFTETRSFIDSQGRSALFRYTFDDRWSPDVPRGLVVFFHGNNSMTQQEIVDGFFPAIERDALARGLVPVVIASPETRSPPQETIRQWKSEDERLLHEFLQSNLGNSFAVDFDRIFFDGASQGTCFIHDFLSEYGEAYGGGFHGGCGCYNAPDALWAPDERFRENFKVYISVTRDDFLYESSQEGYGYYRYTLGLNTRGELEVAGTHCSAYWGARERALDWLTGVSELPEDPFYPHWKRVFIGERVAGVTIDASGTVYVLQNTPEQTSILFSSNDGGTSWSTVSQLAFAGDDLDAAAGNLFITSASALYRSTNGGQSFELVDTNSYLPALVADSNGHIYRGEDFIHRSVDSGDTWRSLGGVNQVAFAPENTRFLNPDSLSGRSPRIITGQPTVGYTANEDPIPNGGIAVGAVTGSDWHFVAVDDALEGFFSNAAWDGSTLWGLSSGAPYPYTVSLQRSDDEGQSWVSAELPAPYQDYYGFNTRISAPRENLLIVHGDFNSSWVSSDGSLSWQRAYGARTLFNASLSFDPAARRVYATDGESVFQLILTESAEGEGAQVVASTTDLKIAATYAAFFNRAPDFNGLSFWRDNAAAGGLSDLELMRQLALGFSQHPTFVSAYSGLDDIAFIDSIYLNVGGEPADTAGRQYWLRELQSGMTRSEFVASFVFGALSLTSETLESLVESGEITRAEADAATARQRRVQNKASVALQFTLVLAENSNLDPATDPLDPAALERDEAYRASVAIISTVTDDPESTSAPLALLASQAGLDEILSQFGVN